MYVNFVKSKMNKKLIKLKNKIMKKLSILVLFALLSLNSYAEGGNFILNVKNTKGNEISFALNGIEKATIAIYDTDHNLIFSEKAEGKKGILKFYNLDNLPEGNYVLVVKTDSKIAKHQITVDATAATLSKRAFVEIYKNNFNNNKIALK